VAAIWPVALTASYLDGAGRPRTGRVVADCDIRLAQADGGLTIGPAQYQGWLDADGALVIPAMTWDDETTPATFTVQELIDQSTPVVWSAVAIPPATLAPVTDGVLVKGSAVLTSATRGFTSDLVGEYVGSLILPTLTRVASVESSTSLTLDNEALASASGLTVQLGASFDLSSIT